MKQFDTHCTPNENIVMETGFCDREEQGKLKDAKCSSSLNVSKRARVPQMDIVM